MTKQRCHTGPAAHVCAACADDEKPLATCPECFRRIEQVRGYWTCSACCLAWPERPESPT